MEDILKEINSVSGVSGSFVCNETGEVITSAMASVFDAGTLHAIGRVSAQTLAGLQTSRRRKISEIDLVFAEGRVIIKTMSGGYLVILCIRNTNVPLLNLTANMALKRLASALSKPKESKPARAPAPEPAPPAAQPVSAPAPAAPAAPQDDPMRVAIPALADLAEALILGVGDMGVGRTTLLTALEPRYRAIMSKYSFLNERSFTFGRLNLSHFNAPQVPPTEAVAALGELIGEIFRSGNELLGKERAEGMYHRAYNSVTRKNGTALQQPAVLAILPQGG